MNIELIHPPHPQAIEDRLDPPLGLLHIASMLEHHNHKVVVNDLSGIPQKDWEVGLAEIYGITIYAPTLKLSEGLAELCRSKNKDSKIVVGGAHPTAVPEDMHFSDIVVIGDGELPMLEIIAEFPNNRRYYEKSLERKLDLYPNPAYHLIDINSYKRTIGGKPSLPILSSRGCSFKCAFCGSPKQNKIIKFRSPKEVAKEIKYLKDRYGVEKFTFQDDTFTLKRKNLYEILDLLKPLNIGFRCHVRAGIDKSEDYLRLKDAGCDYVSFGVETGSQKMLDRMNKNATVKDNENSIRWAKEAGLLVRAFILIGFPGETKETIEETKQFIERTSPEQYFVNTFTPFPGTDVWNNPKKYDITWINKDFNNYFLVDKTGYGGINVETKFLTREGFREMDMDFRKWISKRKRIGPLLEYEKKIEKTKKEY